MSGTRDQISISFINHWFLNDKRRNVAKACAGTTFHEEKSTLSSLTTKSIINRYRQMKVAAISWAATKETMLIPLYTIVLRIRTYIGNVSSGWRQYRNCELRRRRFRFTRYAQLPLDNGFLFHGDSELLKTFVKYENDALPWSFRSKQPAPLLPFGS